MIAAAEGTVHRSAMHADGENPHLDLWLRLHCAPGVGPRTASRLFDRFGSIEAIFAAPPAELSQLPGGPALPGALHDAAVRARVSAWLDRRHACGYRVVTLGDAEYPERLRRTPKAPVVLFVRGTLASRGPAVAVVGSRRSSDEGAFIAAGWAEAFARAGVTVVSGLARGIDAASHRGALAGGGATIAVLGSGPDRIYPREHTQLADRMAASGGAVISQFWPGTGPDRGLFPTRNLTIAGLSDLVLVVEAARNSGALGTAQLARSMHRPVFAVPGPLSRHSARGSNELLKSGALMALAPEDILKALGLSAVAPGEAEPTLEPELQPLFARIEPGGISVDRLAQTLRWPVGVVLQRLLALELRGFVRSLPGQRYMRQR